MSSDWDNHPTTDIELNEASLMQAIKDIRSFATEAELQRAKPRKLLVTEEGIAMVRYRYETEPEFRASVQEYAARPENAEYRQLCEDAGLILEPEAS